MREIKFRAWDDEDSIIIGWEQLEFEREAGEEIYIWKIIDATTKELRDFKLMQYTGLKDKNGVEIYESDLLKHFDGEVRIVAYDDNSASFALQRNDERRKFVSGLTDHEFYEVIGNMYENPELLK